MGGWREGGGEGRSSPKPGEALGAHADDGQDLDPRNHPRGPGGPSLEPARAEGAGVVGREYLQAVDEEGERPVAEVEVGEDEVELLLEGPAEGLQREVVGAHAEGLLDVVAAVGQGVSAAMLGAPATRARARARARTPNSLLRCRTVRAGRVTQCC